MLRIEPSVLTMLTKAQNSTSHTATAFALRTMDAGSNAAVEQRDALVAALLRHPRDVARARKEAGPTPPAPPSPVELEIWSLYADEVDNPLVRGHLHHLLLDAGHGRTPDHVRGAAGGYLDAARHLLTGAQVGHALPRAAACLTTAGELALKFKQHDLRDQAITDAVALAERLLGAAEDEGRVLLVVLKGLQAMKYDVADFAERAADRFVQDVDDRIGFLDVLRRDAPQSRYAEIDSAVVHALLDAAEDTDSGHRRLYFRTRAATEAQKRGLPSLRARAERALQHTTVEWTTIRNVHTIPPFLIAGQRALVDAAPDLRSALWLTVPDAHPAMRAQEQAEADGALEGLLRIPRSRINPAGPVFVHPPVDAPDAAAVAMQVHGLQLYGVLTAIQLHRIHERFRPDEFDVAAALVHETVLPQPRALALARAFLHYWLEDFDAAVCVALPRVEDILRQLLRPRVSVVAVAQGHRPGGVAMLNELLQSMQQARYPADWSRALELLLVDSDRGMNLRNDTLHGLTDTPPRHHAALILQAALYLLSHAHGQRTAPATTDGPL
ncbi:DUF4209 domain-containing protein [Kitasatospora sp. NPDC002227]|uniref:DUF4209 domain-containing protein n=1 Tax=Kitasatospora sp. NPDC002227 TaxID=3154773 RepID=UPI00331F299D